MSTKARQPHELEHWPVEYVSASHCGTMGPFRKLEDYSYQSEVRFLTMRPIEGDSLILKLGSLRHIATVIDLRDDEAA